MNLTLKQNLSRFLTAAAVLLTVVAVGASSHASEFLVNKAVSVQASNFDNAMASLPTEQFDVQAGVSTFAFMRDAATNAPVVLVNGQVPSDLVIETQDSNHNGMIDFEALFKGDHPTVSGQIMALESVDSNRRFTVNLDVDLMAERNESHPIKQSNHTPVFHSAGFDRVNLVQPYLDVKPDLVNDLNQSGFFPQGSESSFAQNFVVSSTVDASGRITEVAMGSCDCSAVTGSFCSSTDCDNGTNCSQVGNDSHVCSRDDVVVARP